MRLTNRQFRNESTTFKDACSQARVKPTVRQASKFINSKGIAWEVAYGHNGYQPLEKGDPGYAV